MLRNNNQEISVRIGRKSIRDNRLRFGILVGVTAVIVMTITALYIGSMYVLDMLNMQGIQAEGNYHIGAQGLTEEEALRLAGNDRVKEAGVASVLGEVTNDQFFYWNLTAASADEVYMRNCNAYPETGSVPKAENEIAVDTRMMDELGIPRKTGEKIVLRWENNGVESEKEFTISGFWDGSKTTVEGHVWISGKFADSQEKEEYRVYANLKNPYFLGDKAEKIAQNAGIEDGKLYVNGRFRMAAVFRELISVLYFWLGIGFVFFCGKLILGSVFYLAVVKDMPYYACMKMQGMTARQRKGILNYQVKYVCIFGIPVGIIAGTIFGNLIMGEFLAGKWDVPLKFHFSSLIVAIVSGVLMVFLASRKPVKLVAELKALTETSKKKQKVRKEGRSNKRQRNRGRNVVWNLALRELRGGKKLFSVILTLAAGMGLFCVVSTMQKSYRAELYIESETFSDIILEDASLSASEGNLSYNPYNQTVSPKLLNELENLGTVSDMGSLYWGETGLALSDKVYENTIAFYEADDGARLEYMSYDEGWLDAYDQMKETQKCMAVVLGTDGLVNEELEKVEMFQGSFDWEKFETGNYIIADTLSDEKMRDGTYPNYEVGDMVEIAGETFEVMALISMNDDMSVLAEGSTSMEAAFSPFFLVHSDVFQRMFPGHTVKKQFLNAEGENLKKTIQFLENYQSEQNQNLYMITEEMLEERFRSDIDARIRIFALISATIVIAGGLSFVNMVTVSIWRRRETFHRLHSIGMTRREIWKMAVTESLVIAVLTSVTAVVIGALAAGVGMRIYLASAWTSIYTCSMTPLLILIPLLFLAAVVVPLAALKKVHI